MNEWINDPRLQATDNVSALQAPSVASLGWVTPGAPTEVVTRLFFPEKPGDLFLLIAVTITIAFYYFHSGVTPSRVLPHTFFYLSDLVSPLFFVNLPTKNFSFGCHPWRVSPGAVRPRLPPSDATGPRLSFTHAVKRQRTFLSLCDQPRPN